MSLILSGTDGLSDVDGSAATPAIRGTDANTGIFFPAADTIAFSEGGAESARIDSAGNFGLGVTPSAWYSGYKAFQFGNLGGGALSQDNTNGFTHLTQNTTYTGNNSPVYQTSGYATRYTQAGGAHYWLNAASGTAGNAITFTQAMTLNASGNLGVAETSPSSQIHINGNSDNYFTAGLRVNRYTTAGQYGTVNYANGLFNITAVDTALSSPTIAFRTSTDGSTATERARIDSSGNLSVGSAGSFNTNTRLYLLNSVDGSVSNPQFALGGAVSTYTLLMWLDGTAAYIGQNSNSRALRMFSGSAATAGVNLAVGGTAWGTFSDERIKTNLVPIENAIQKVATLRTVTGRYTTDEESVSRAFLIAQDVQAVLPEAVDIGTDEDKTLFLKYTETIPLLVAAIKEQQAIITQLQADVAALKGAP